VESGNKLKAAPIRSAHGGDAGISGLTTAAGNKMHERIFPTV
jgi:hypothetical protein